MKRVSDRQAAREVLVMKGEEIIAEGTMAECAVSLNVRVETIYFYTTAAYARRLAKAKSIEKRRLVVFLDEDESEGA